MAQIMISEEERKKMDAVVEEVAGYRSDEFRCGLALRF